MVYGTKVKLLGKTGPSSGAPYGWYKVLAPNGMTGYATAEFLKSDIGPSPAPPPMPEDRTYIQPDVWASTGKQTATVLGNPGANLRTTASSTGAILTGLFNGSKVIVLSPTPVPGPGSAKGWMKVQAPSGASGYVSAEFLRLDAPSITSTKVSGEDMFSLSRRRSGIIG